MFNTSHAHTQNKSLPNWTYCVHQDLSEEVVTKVLSGLEIPDYRPAEKVSSSADLVFDFSVLVGGKRLD